MYFKVDGLTFISFQENYQTAEKYIYSYEAGELTELINTCVVPFGQKCLEAAFPLKYEPLKSCITLHSV